MQVIQPRLEWHILTLEATPERARSIVQNETLAMLKELQQSRELLGIAIKALQEIALGDTPTEHPDEYGGCWGPVAKDALDVIAPPTVNGEGRE